MPAGPFHVAIYRSPGGGSEGVCVIEDLVSAWHYADQLRAIVAQRPHPDVVEVMDLDSGEWVTHDDYLDIVCEPGEQQGAGDDDSA